MEQSPTSGPRDARAPARSDPPDPSAVVEIDHYELDEIPLYHLPMAGSTILTIAFRVGRADEPVTRGGMTHLAEHLILTAVSDGLDHSNGATEPLRVTFMLRGTPSDAATFLRDVSRSIERPPIGRMHEEANVLRTEAAGRAGGMSMALRLMWARTGYQGIGTVSLPELFLRTLDEGVLRAWIADNLVAGNAAIWIAGEIPDDLYVALPPGPRRPPPEVRMIPGLETPTRVIDDVPGIGASFFVERNAATATAFRTLDRNLRRQLRVDRGLGYDVATDYQAVGADAALVSVWATCLPNAARDVERIMLETVDDVAARGPSEDDLAQQYERYARESLDPLAVPARLDHHVRDLLLGRQPESAAEQLDEQWRLQPEQVAVAFRRARDSMVLLVPPGSPPPQRPYKPYPGPSAGPPGKGATFELIGQNRGLLRKGPSLKMAISDGGVFVDGSDRTRLFGITWEDSVAVVAEPDGWTLIGRDGTLFTIHAGDWRDGRSAVKLIGRYAPRDVVVPMGS